MTNTFPSMSSIFKQAYAASIGSLIPERPTPFKMYCDQLGVIPKLAIYHSKFYRLFHPDDPKLNPMSENVKYEIKRKLKSRSKLNIA